MSVELIAFTVCSAEFVLFAGIYAGVTRIQNRKWKGATILPDELTVVIPFRNERGQLPALLESLEGQTFRPKIIFVDDHSTDDAQTFLQNSLGEGMSLLTLKDAQGKKAALQLGIESADTEWILTLDADVVLSDRYFDELFKKVSWSELNVLPVNMESETSFWSKFWSQEYTHQKLVNWFTAGWEQPITASGANLLFTKQLYLDSLEFRIDTAVASGDDQFLVEFARKNNRQLQLITNQKLTVFTAAKSTFLGGLKQRLRWIQKMRWNRDKTITLVGFLGMAYHVFTYTGIGILAFNQPYLGTAALFVKLTCQNVLAHRIQPQHFKVFDRLGYTLLFPVYVLCLVGLLFFWKPKWKGRA